jgi:hypothetical protein
MCFAALKTAVKYDGGRLKSDWETDSGRPELTCPKCAKTRRLVKEGSVWKAKTKSWFKKHSETTA